MFKCVPGCEAECCGNVPVPKSILKKNRNKIHRKYEKIELGHGQIHPVTADGKCVFLDKQFHCEIYNERPFICKEYGNIIELQCPYIDINGNPRGADDIMKVKQEIKNFVDEHFFQYEMKYKSGKQWIPPFGR